MAKKTSGSAGGPNADSQEFSFEDATAELNRIVARLESGQEPLEQSLAAFERGMALLRTCHEKLDAAAHRIEIVTGQTADDEVTTERFNVTATHLPAPAAGSRSRKTAKPEITKPEIATDASDTEFDGDRGLF